MTQQAAKAALAALVDTAHQAEARGDSAGARAAWRRLVLSQPDEALWRLKLAAVSEDPSAALAACAAGALAADRPLVALLAALRAGLDGLPERFADYLQGSKRLGQGAPPAPPLAPLTPPPADAADALPAWPAPVFGAPLRPIPLLSSLDAEGFEAVVGALSSHQLSAGEVLLAEGSPAAALYLVAGGELAVIKADAARGEVVLGHLRAGAVVGEMALVLDRPRSATVRATTDVALVRIELEALKALSRKRPAVRDGLARFTQERLLATLVGTSPLFADLDPVARGAVLWRFEQHDLLADEVVVTEGDPAAALCLVVTGAVEVSRADGGRDVTVARLGPGEVFGEIGLIRGGQTTATVVATTDTQVLRLNRSDFEALCETFPAIRARAAHLADVRLAENRFIFEDDEFIEAAD